MKNLSWVAIFILSVVFFQLAEPVHAFGRRDNDLEEAADDAGDAVDDAGDNIKDAVDDAGDEID